MAEIDSNVTKQKKGRIAENMAQNEFLKHGFDVYATIADDNGIDFIARCPNDSIFYVQVKSVVQGNYAYIEKSKFKSDDNYLVAYIVFDKDLMNSTMYIIKGSDWTSNLKTEYEGLLKHYKYEKKDNETRPEYGISSAKKYIDTLHKHFSTDKFFKEIKNGGKQDERR